MLRCKYNMQQSVTVQVQEMSFRNRYQFDAKDHP